MTRLNYVEISSLIKGKLFFKCCHCAMLLEISGTGVALNHPFVGSCLISRQQMGECICKDGSKNFTVPITEKVTQ